MKTEVKTYTYSDTPAKKLVRLNVLECARNVLGKKRFTQGRHLGLASRETGDMHTLLGLGVPLRQCTLAEKDRDAWLDAYTDWHGLADIRNQDIMEVAEAEGKFTHVNFDTCAPIRVNILHQVNRLAANHLEQDGVLTCWFLAGREHQDITDEVGVMCEELRKHLSPGIRKKLGREYPMAVLEDRLVYIARALVLEQSVSTYVHNANGRHMKLIRIWTYTSEDVEQRKQGSPMVVVQLQECGRNTVGFDQMLLAAIKHDHFMVVGDQRRRLRAMVAKMIDDGVSPRHLLNIPPGSLSAYKANLTRKREW